MKYFKIFIYSVLFSTLIIACKKDEEDAPIKPENLVIEATVAEDGSGLVSFSSRADNAAHYNYYFGTSSNEAPFKSNDGKASKKYETSGEYIVRVEAVSSTNQTLAGTKTITVVVLKPENLVIEAAVSTDGSGVVEFTSSAVNAILYNYYFGVSSSEAPFKSTDGKASKTYEASGEYSVMVEAVSISNQTLVGTKTISVQVEEKEPANLVIEATVSTNGSGKVAFSASADNANFYNYYFGEAPSETPTKSTTGTTSYNYSSSGVYTVKVEAYNVEKFITATKEITITVEKHFGYTTPDNYDGMNLVWRDEFEGDALNLADWTHELGTGQGGWGNNELQYYRAENTSVSDGILTITAKKESFGGKGYTSSRMITKDKQSFQYGRIDIRAKLPQGQGLWPALWMLGNNFSTEGWPKCGEIDIMEMIGGGDGRDNTVHGTVHWYANAGVPHASYGGKTELPSGNFADEFHVFSIVWDETLIKWYLDDVKYHEISITPAELSEFHQKFFFIFNVAVGGNWPQNPNESTVFPQSMQVDYVRVFQKQ